MQRVLVTGASGFIGHHVIAELLKNNFSVIATSANSSKVEGKNWIKDVEYIPFDLKNFKSGTDYFHFFGSPDIMIHLAWEGLPNYKSLFHFEDNLPRHYAFLKNMLNNGLKDLSVTGTCLEYGMEEGCLSEEMKTDPRNAYAISKDALQKFLSQLASITPFSFKWIRLFYMYGGGQSPNSILSQLQKAVSESKDFFNMSGGEQVRDYLPIETVAKYLVQIATQQQVLGIINCCSGKPVKLKDFVNNYLKQKSLTIKLNLGYYPYPDYEPMEFWGNDKKLSTIVGKAET